MVYGRLVQRLYLSTGQFCPVTVFFSLLGGYTMLDVSVPKSLSEYNDTREAQLAAGRWGELVAANG